MADQPTPEQLAQIKRLDYPRLRTVREKSPDRMHRYEWVGRDGTVVAYGWTLGGVKEAKSEAMGHLARSIRRCADRATEALHLEYR